MSTVRRVIDVLARRGITLTLVDVGASVEPFPAFRPLLPYATYVGFDPDLRDMHEQSDGSGRRIIVNKAVVDRPDQDSVRFHLTATPTCSSTLEPDPAVVGPYLHAHRFDVVDQADVPATTLDEAVKSAGVHRVDWIKLDTQGTDVRLLRSMSDGLWSGLMAIDAEPGFDSYYQGEDTFGELHVELRSRGFWLADLSLIEGVRLRRDVFDRHIGSRTKVQRVFYETALKRSPMAAGPRYLRTVESLAADEAGQDDYLRLWACAYLSGNHPFALDVAGACEAAHGPNPELTSALELTTRAARSYALRNAWRHAGKLRLGRIRHALRWH